MASVFTASLLFSLFISSSFLYVSSFEFDVADGWAVPSQQNSDFYNKWASENRFQVGDTISFKYKKDSVMVVSETDYDQCNSSHPIFFSNNGDTVYQFDHSGPFYFISGVAGHCEKGEKMIIKVLGNQTAPGTSPTPDDDHNSHSNPSTDTNATVPHASASSSIGIMQFIVSILGLLLF